MKKFIISSVVLSFIFGLFALSANAAKPSDYGLKEGDLISAIFSDDPDVYIINDSGYKRLFLNPTIFNFYGHLGGFFNVKLVSTEVRDAFITSGLFRDCESNDPKVYGVDIDGEDTGKLHWVNVSAENASSEDQEFFKKVFCINNNEFNWYPRGSEFKAVKDVPKYERMKGKETVSTQEKIAENTEIKNIGQSIICHYPPGNPAAHETITVGASALKAHLDHGDVVGACPNLDITPPIISNISAVTSQTTATITWATNENSDSQVQYGLTINYTNSTALNTSMVASHSVFLSDLSLSTTYHYRVKSKDASGNLAVSEDHTFTTDALSADTTPPLVPAGLVAVAVSSFQINLSWAVSTDDVGVTGYRIYRGGTQIAISTTNSYSNTGLSPSTTYLYTVAAYDASGNVSGQSSQVSATTQQAETGPVGYWPFDGNANDESGIGNNGTIYGATFVNGMKGQALYFDGSDDVTIPASSSLDLANEFTLEAWIYPESTGNVAGDAGKRVISKRGSSSGFVLSAGKFESWEQNGHNHDFGRVYKSGTGRWYYLVATKDDTETQSTISVYINGELVEQRTESKYYIALNNQSVTIGVDLMGGHYFRGIIDEAKIYNRALSPQEVLQNYQLTYSEPTYNRADFTPPQITNIQATNITQNSATITWTTDELSNSVVTIGSSEMFYAPYLAGDIAYDHSSDSNVLSHSILMDGLTSGRVFYYKVASLDVNGNSIWSETKSFVTQ